MELELQLWSQLEVLGTSKNPGAVYSSGTVVQIIPISAMAILKGMAQATSLFRF